jgi:hypothetical protein
MIAKVLRSVLNEEKSKNDHKIGRMLQKINEILTI